MSRNPATITCPSCQARMKCKKKKARANGIIERRYDCLNPECPARLDGEIVSILRRETFHRQYRRKIVGAIGRRSQEAR